LSHFGKEESQLDATLAVYW